MIQGEQIAESSGVCFELDGDLITKHPDFAELLQVADELNVSVFDLILSGGEDHCFLATGTELNGFEIGKVMPGSGIRLLSVATPQPGWNHFK
jgi:thiamine-monophosphate kinase